MKQTFKTGDTCTVMLLDGTYIKRAEIIYIPENEGLYQFLDMNTMKVAELLTSEFTLMEYSPELFKEYCKCAKPDPKPHPNGKDIYCQNCNQTLKI